MSHVVRWRADRLDQVIDEIAATGYGLTLGIHSRIDTTVRHILGRLRVGNSYVNRSMIGAVVGVQPFGGEGLSGTGPKAGGPRYLYRFGTERTISTDTTAAGGNATLLSFGDEIETVTPQDSAVAASTMSLGGRFRMELADPTKPESASCKRSATGGSPPTVGSGKNR